MSREITSEGLPEGWESAKIADLIAADGLFSDGDWVESKDQDPNGSIRLLQLADIGDGRFIDKSSRFVNEEKFEKLRCTEVLERDVLIARMPDPLGRACLVPGLKQKSITVVDVAIVRPSAKSVDPAWLMHAINSPEIRQQMELGSTGSTRKRIARGKISNIELPLPPLAEQKRIAGKLELLLGRIDACRTRLDRLPAILKRFRQAVLAAATSGKLTEEWREENGVEDEWEDEWEELPVGEVCSHSFYGPRFGKEEYTSSEEGIPTIRTTDMTRDGRIQITDDTPRVIVPDDKLEHFRVRKDDLLVTRTGSIGVMAVFEEDCAAIPSAYLIRFRFRPRVLTRYMFFCLMSPYGQEHLGFSSTAITQPNINAEAIKRIVVSVPALVEQQEIVRRVEDLFAFADRIESRLAEARKTVDRLTPAALAKAFRGELVPQDPDDEPASKLLERIRASKASSSEKPQRGKRRTGKAP